MADEGRIEVVRSVAAPPEDVFDALTDDDAIPRWFSVWSGCALTSVDVDCRVDGGLRIESRERSGAVHWVRARFTEVNRPSRLAFTWTADWIGGMGAQVTCDIEPSDDGSRVRVVHVGSDDERRDCKGWEWVLAILARGIERAPVAGAGR